MKPYATKIILQDESKVYRKVFYRTQNGIDLYSLVLVEGKYYLNTVIKCSLEEGEETYNFLLDNGYRRVMKMKQHPSLYPPIPKTMQLGKDYKD